MSKCLRCGAGSEWLQGNPPRSSESEHIAELEARLEIESRLKREARDEQYQLELKVSELEAELAKYKIEWQSGAIPADGWYRHKPQPYKDEKYYHCKGQVPHTDWAGPIEPPEEP